MWYSSKMGKESYKKYPSGIEENSIIDELSRTGLPHDLQQQMGLVPPKSDFEKKNYKPLKEVKTYVLPFSIFNDVNPLPEIPGGQWRALTSTPLEPNVYYTLEGKPGEDVDPVLAESPFILFKDKKTTIDLIHEATHILDLNLRSGTKSLLDYVLKYNELLACFNEIISAIYFNNNISYPLFMNLRDYSQNQKFSRLDNLKAYINYPILWNNIKENIKKYGFTETLKRKNIIINKSRDEIFKKYIIYLLEYKKIKKDDYKNIIKYIKKTILDILESKNLSNKEKIKIIFNTINSLKNRGDSWLPKEIEDEIYNFYGNRFLKEK